MALPILLDCDPGHDDAIAIVLALASPELDVKAITSSAGNQTPEKTLRNVLRMLTLLNRTDIPEAGCAVKPLMRELIIADNVHGESGLDGPALPEPAFAPQNCTAVELMAKTLRESAEPVTIVSTGPQTNIALLLNSHPELHSKIARIVIMGGAMGLGNWTPAAEFNIYVDPEAAEIVKRIFSMALSGIGAHKIARILNDEKVPSPTAYKQMNGIHYHIAAKNRNVGLWSSPTVYQMLHNQTYAGNLVQGRHKKISYKTEKTMWLPKSQWIVVENTHEPIIDMETFETVQMMLKERTRSGAKGEIHPLAKKIVCGCCGSFMEQTGRQPRADGTQRRYVRCRMHQRAPEVCGNKTCTEMDALENAVLERIRAYVADYFDPEKVTLPEQDDPIRQREQVRRDELKRLKSEAARRRKAMQELYLDKVSGLIDAVQFSEMNQTFLEEVKKAETRIDTLETELEQQQEETGVVQTQRQRVRELAQVSYLTRELVVLLVHRVIVSPKDPLTGEQKITIEWNF